jgi:metallophosphoesterase superfamily enzyme
MAKQLHERIKFIFNEPALLLDSTLVVSDLHIGTEQELLKKSQSFKGSTERMLVHLLKVAKKANAKKVIVLGDVLHAPLASANSETSFELMNFFAKLNSEVKTEVIPGNLDAGIEMIEKFGVKLHPATGIIVNNVSLSHGHLPLQNSFYSCEKIICAQEHFFKKRRNGWIVAKLSGQKAKSSPIKFNPSLELVFVPQFNPLISLLKIPTEEMELCETTSNNLFKLDDAIAYSLQGGDLGKSRLVWGAFDGEKESRAGKAN